MDAYRILMKELENKSRGEIAKELKLSKTTISLVARKKYPNPEKIYQIIKERYGATKIIGVQVVTDDLAQLMKEIEEC